MTTKESIIELAEKYMRGSGYHTFSFHDISRIVGIKTSSIHYHFPVKADLGEAVIKERLKRLKQLKEETSESDPVKKMALFLSIYSRMGAESNVCLAGSVATGLPAMEEKIRNRIQELSGFIVEWVTEILEEGEQSGIFSFETDAKTKALMIISTVMGMLQLSRISDEPDEFRSVLRAILQDLQKSR
ncbi:MAG: TetR/AcrR family transcriptional regulator [Balneolaceae bacterium]